MKKRFLVICLAVICCLVLASCSTEKTFNIEDAAKIRVMSGTTGESVDVTDEDLIQQITDNISAITFKKGARIDSSGWSYNIRWYDVDGQEIESITTGGDGTNLFYDDYNWSATSGGIDTGLLDEVLGK